MVGYPTRRMNNIITSFLPLLSILAGQYVDQVESYLEFFGFAGPAKASEDLGGWWKDQGRVTSKQIFCVPEACGEALQISARIKYGFFRTDNSTIEDPQLGYGQMTFSGLDGFQFGFWLTPGKVYAYYARLPNGQTPLEYYTSAAFLIPIADRDEQQTDLYELYLNKYDKLVSWRINNFELFRIRKPGLAQVDSKFMVADYGGYFPIEGYPSQGIIVLGFDYPDGFGQPHTACQGTLFNQCLDSLADAKRTECTYGPIIPAPPYPTGPELSVLYEKFAVISRKLMRTCPDWTDGRYQPGSACPCISNCPMAQFLAEMESDDQGDRLAWQKPRPANPIPFKKK